MDTNETTIYYAVLITGIVLGIILFYFAITIYRSHNKHFRLLRKHVLAEIELLEQERTRIAHDLHDDLGPLLLIAQKHIQTTNGKAIEDSEHLAKAIKKIEELHERFAGIAQNLTPKVLVTKGLQTALEDFIEQYNEVTMIDIQLSYSVQSKLTNVYALHIYRIVQELIHNSVKHSGASTILLQLAERKQILYLFYSDNGTGINLNGKETAGGGLGLGSLKSRAVLLGGKMNCTSSFKKGTSYFFELPIKTLYE